MKIAVIKGVANRLMFLPAEDVSIIDGNPIGYIDLPIEKPKRTVVKEVVASYAISDFGHSKEAHYWNIPRNARNIKCTYEVEE